MICRPRRLLLAAALAAASASASASSSSPSDASDPSSSPPRAHELTPSYAFETYLAHFGKSYPDPVEHARRSILFASNLERILAHNEGRMDEDGELIAGGYVMGVNRFTDAEEGELPLGYEPAYHPRWREQLRSRMPTTLEGELEGGAYAREGRRLGSAHAESYSRPPDFDVDDVSSLPSSVDWSAEGKVNPVVPNQGGCGSCWAFAATAVVESALAIAEGGDASTSLSQMTMLECAPDPRQCGGKGDCTGSTVELGLNYIAGLSASKTGGMYDLDDVPYSASDGGDGRCEALTEGKSPSVGIEGWTQLPVNDYKATMNAVAKVGPMALAVAAGEWAMYEKGVFETSATTVNHAVVLVGYGVDEVTGEKYYKIRNSWGKGFGEDGYIRIKRTDDDDDVCATDDRPLVGVACALDENGDAIDVEPVEVCGTGAVLFDVSYPTGVYRMD